LFQANQRTNKIIVKMLTLNEFISKKSIKNIEALKIDVEGYEDRMLMPFFINNHISIFPKLVIIEHSSSNEWDKDVIDLMLKNGYSLELKTRGNSILKLNIQ